MLNLKYRHQRGFLAIVLVVFLVVFVAMAAAIVSMSTSGARSAADHVQGSAALYLAESGIEWAAREMFDVNDPQDDCEALAGASNTVNASGSFTITAAQYFDDDDGEACRVTSVGAVAPASRTVSASVRIFTGSGEVGSIFDNPPLWTTGPNPFGNVSPGVLTLNRNSPCAGPGSTFASAGPGVITDSFNPGDVVYFAADFFLDRGNPAPGVSILRITIEHDNGVAQCNIDISSPFTSPCAANAGDPLYDAYNLVLKLGDGFGATQINSVHIEADWEVAPGSPACDIRLVDACIGRQSHCLGFEPTSDPVIEGSWDENP